MIGVVVRDMAFLKILTPIIRKLHKAKALYILYYMDCPRPGKEYARPTLDRLKTSAEDIVKNAHNIISFTNNKQLVQQLVANKITKLVSVEIWLCDNLLPAKLKHHKIKSYSLQYLTDSIWQSPESITSIDKVYYMSEHVMKTHHMFAGVQLNSKRDRCIGSPVFDPICPNSGSGDILVLTPNIRAEHVSQTFRTTQNFLKIIEKLAQGGDLIFKTRKKQWLPEEAKNTPKTLYTMETKCIHRLPQNYSRSVI